jgi:excisionase family DNA binding protein
MALIGTSEAARMLGVSVRRVQAMIRAAQIPAEKIGRDWLMKEADIARIGATVRKPGRPSKKRP